MKRIFGVIIFILVLSSFTFAQEQEKLSIKSSVFASNGYIPKMYTCQGKDINPPLTIEHVPQNAKSLILIVDDPDAPIGTWVHWVVYNIDPEIRKIETDSVPGEQGYNDFGKKDYGGPCPPYGTHRYFFKIFAMDKKVELSEFERITKDLLLKALKNNIIERAEYVGLYKKF